MPDFSWEPSVSQAHGNWRFKETYQVETRSSAQILHDNPQLVPAQEASLVLGDIAAGAGAEHRDFLLDFLDIIFARLKVDLWGSSQLVLSENRTRMI